MLKSSWCLKFPLCADQTPSPPPPPQNLFALIPLALILGDVTEDLGLRFGDVIGGLINATFGNVVELVLSIAALEKGLYTLVASSLVGSILSNLLLVLGTCATHHVPMPWCKPAP